MRDAIDESISRDAAGLDDMMLKKMLLAYNTGKYSRNADIIIEITSDEATRYGEVCRGCENCVGTRRRTDENNPFCIVQGKTLPQLNLKALEKAANRVTTFFGALFGEGSVFDSEIYQREKDEREDKQNKYYLHSKGVLKFVNEDDEELVYYNEEVMKKIYEDEFQANRYGSRPDYALSVWEYLSDNCYTDGDKGMKIYAHETIEEELIEWTFEADNPMESFKDILDIGDKALSGVAINKQIIKDEYLTYDTEGWILKDGILDTAKKTYRLQDIDYYSIVSQYSTPVEFMIDLLNVSSSPEFVDAFIDKVVNKTEIKLKLYRTTKLTSEEKTEKAEEKTTVDCEANVTASIISVDYDGDGDGYKTGDAGIKVKVSIDDGEALFGLVDALAINVKLTNIPDNVQGINLKIQHQDAAYYYTVPDEFGSGIVNLFGNALDRPTCRFTVKAWFTTRYMQRESNSNTSRYTTKLSTETKLDIAVERAKTWYGILDYNNYIQEDLTFKTQDSNGNIINAEEFAQGFIRFGKPNMISKRKSTQTYENNDSNREIFADNSIEGFAWSEIGSRVEKWYTGLTSDQVVFWIMPGGPITHSIVYQTTDHGLQLSNENELLNIRYVYAMQNGPADWWVKRYYLPTEMKIKTTDYKVGYLYETVDKYLVQGTPTVQENSDFFLSLLKNRTGEYSVDATYKPNGKEVEYTTVYGAKDRVGKFFETSAEMFFNLLESSPNTQGLADVMRYILYQYTTQNYGVTEFNYNIINREGFEYI